MRGGEGGWDAEDAGEAHEVGVAEGGGGDFDEELGGGGGGGGDCKEGIGFVDWVLSAWVA